MIDTILTITGMIVWMVIVFAMILSAPVLVSFIIGYILKKLDILYDTRHKIVSFVDWYVNKLETRVRFIRD